MRVGRIGGLRIPASPLSCSTESQVSDVPAIQKFAECSSIDAAKARSRQADAFVGRQLKIKLREKLIEVAQKAKIKA